MRISILALSAAAGLFGAAAHATTITGADLATCAGTAGPCSPATGVTLSSTGGTITSNNVGGVVGIGISGAPTTGEIDSPEQLTIDFASAVTLNSFRVGAFFNGPEFGDFNERGQVTINNGVATYTFDVLGDSTATISSGLGTVVNCGLSVAGGAGCYDFTGNPLGNTLITRLVFTAINNTPGFNSDYTLAGLSFTPAAVPVPGALGLMALGLGGIAGFGRRRKTA